MIRLEEVNPENWRLGLNVSEAQKRFVAGGQPGPGAARREYSIRNGFFRLWQTR